MPDRRKAPLGTPVVKTSLRCEFLRWCGALVLGSEAPGENLGPPPPLPGAGVCYGEGMGYSWAILFVAVLLPLVLFFVMRGRTPRADSEQTKNRFPTQPAADEPTPVSGEVNQIKPEARKRVPPA